MPIKQLPISLSSTASYHIVFSVSMNLATLDTSYKQNNIFVFFHLA